GFDFGNVAVGTTSPQQTVTITNKGSAPVVMSGAGGAAGVFGGVQDCQGTTLAPGASCHMFYAFTPTALGAATGTTSGSWNGQPFNFTFTGNGVRRFLITATGFDFGAIPIGGPSPRQTVTITNKGSTPVVMSGAGGAAGVFGGVQDCQGTTLAPGASCHMFYAFTPTALGAVTGTTSGSWNGQPFNFTFKGTGLNRFLITPTGLDFGDITVGSTSPQQIITITNRSSAAVVMSGAGGAAGVFGGVQDCQGTTLASGASCHMFYAFTPTALGAATGTTSGTWNGQPFGFTFAGTGQ
ncbi:MAG TPA: choice-of-anchor D domain-containing protein, partial [Mycobacteriales bacterium]|nr:choice-of-anchor D domain-containing protein [Mycobacteriales bacterium]